MLFWLAVLWGIGWVYCWLTDPPGIDRPKWTWEQVEAYRASVSPGGKIKGRGRS